MLDYKLSSLLFSLFYIYESIFKTQIEYRLLSVAAPHFSPLGPISWSLPFSVSTKSLVHLHPIVTSPVFSSHGQL